MTKFSKADPGTLPRLRCSSLQQLVTVEPCKELASSDGLTTKGQYLHVAAVAQLSLQAKLKTDENGHVLKVALDTLSCFVEMLFTFFRKCINILFEFKN